MKVYIILWYYADHSNNGIVGVYTNETRALQDYKLITSLDSAKNFDYQVYDITE